jgi:uncharacterized iron-regulated membrane protein
MTWPSVRHEQRPSRWRQWVERPEHLIFRQLTFQLHLWIGAAAAAWLLVMSLTGSVLVFRDQIARVISIEWVFRLHRSLLAGAPGQIVNAAGAASVIVLCVTGAVIWWPGRAHWRRSLTIEWRARFPRISWDAHSALGFWFFLFVLMWGVSGLYLSRAQMFDVLYRLDPADRITDRVLFALSALHFGRFNMATQITWAILGSVPAMLAITGLFICCRRVIFGKPSNPKHASVSRS